MTEDALATAAGAARLDGWMADAIAGYAGPATVVRLSGGQSCPTYRIDAASGPYVLRSKPPGALLPTAHAVDREFRVMRALAGTGVPVPEGIALCEDEAVIGRMFYVMEHLEGRVFFDQTLPGMTPEARAAVYDDMNRIAARLHRLDPVALGLGDYGRSGAYVARQLARWSKQYRAGAEAFPIPAMDRLIPWLEDHRPEERETRLIHGDYRLDNMILHPHEPRVVAVLDWELSTLGDPMVDFAYHMLSWRVPPQMFRGLGGVDLAALGIPGERDYVGRYLERTGQDWPAHWEFYLVFSLFRIAAILHGIAIRAVEGTAADPGAAETGAKAAPLADLAWDMARKAAA